MAPRQIICALADFKQALAEYNIGIKEIKILGEPFGTSFMMLVENELKLGIDPRNSNANCCYLMGIKFTWPPEINLDD